MSWQNEFVDGLGGKLAVKMLEKLICDCIADLIDQGCDPNEPEEFGSTPLWIKLLEDNEVPLSVVKTLFAKGAVIPSAAKGGKTLLSTALSNKMKPEIIAFLLEQGVVASFVDEQGGGTLGDALKEEYDLETIQLLVEAGASVTQRTESDRSPILIAALHSAAADVLAYLLDHGAAINDIDEDGDSVLCNCCYDLFGNGSQIDLLISRGAEVNHRNNQDYSPLAIVCAKSGDEDLLEALVKAGAELDELYAGKTLLMITAGEYNGSALLKLLELGASNISAVEEETGKTALHFACENYTKQAVSALLKHGGEPAIADKDGNKPFDLITDEDDKAEFLMLIK